MENSANTSRKRRVKGHGHASKSSEEIDAARYQQKSSTGLLIGILVVGTSLIIAVEYLL